MITKLVLFSYYRSSAAYRVRIALNLKSLPYEIVPVNLLTREHQTAEFLLTNPSGSVPVLKVGESRIVSQSLAIMELLDDISPERRLVPSDPYDAARVREIANIIACDIHPLNNLRVLNYLKSEFEIAEEPVSEWYCEWIRKGFDAIEQHTSDDPYCIGDTPTMADACLVPQVFNARRFNVCLDNYPNIVRIVARCNRQAAFSQAHPDNQPDKPVSH